MDTLHDACRAGSSSLWFEGASFNENTLTAG